MKLIFLVLFINFVSCKKKVVPKLDLEHAKKNFLPQPRLPIKTENDNYYDFLFDENKAQM